MTREYTKDILRRICLCVEDDMQRAAYDLFIMYKGGRSLILCFGTLGKVLRECKLDAVSDVLLIGTLTQAVDPTSLYGESDGSTVSRLLSCAQNLSNGQKRRMGRKGRDIGYESNRLSNIVSAAQTASVEIVQRNVEDNFLPLLNEDKKRYIVSAILKLIYEDESLDVAKHMNFLRFFGKPKSEYLKGTSFVLSNVIACALLFSCVAVKNTAGKEDAKNINRAFVVSAIKQWPVTLSTLPSSVKEPEAKRTANSNAVQLRIVDEESIEQYLNKVKEKYDKLKTLLYKNEPVPFYDFYVCNDIVEKTIIQSSYSTSNEYRIRTISDATAETLCNCSRFIIISGSGGLGKSMMLRHLLLNSIINYTPGGVIPVFIPVRDYGEADTDIFDYVFAKISQFGTGLTRESLDAVLQSGRVLLLLDGLDEIGAKRETQFEKNLDAFIDRYPDNGFIISSRPHRSFVSYARFTVLHLQAFTKSQAVQLIMNLDFRNDMPEIKQKFLSELDEHLFRTHYGFASNPLLLTIMLMTFERYAEVPSKMHIFYKEAFDTLAKEHDASKAYPRPLKTGLPVDRFEMYFAEFCSRSYHDEKFEFTEREFVDYYDSLSERRKDSFVTSAEDFLYDARANLCLMFYEGGKYFFSHRSFQEYFCAFYFSRQKDKNLKRIGDFFENRRSRNYGDQTFNMLYDMIPSKVEEYIFYPFISNLLAECQRNEGYWTFLETMYPTLSYEAGETDECIENTPNSYIYEFMKGLFFPEECRCEGFPEYPSLIVSEYCYIEDGGVLHLVESSSVRYDYWNEHDEPECVGAVYEVDIHEARKSSRKYSELLKLLDDDDFVLKREYKAAFDYKSKLENAQIPLGDDLFDYFV